MNSSFMNNDFFERVNKNELFLRMNNELFVIINNEPFLRRTVNKELFVRTGAEFCARKSFWIIGQ